MLDTIQRKLTHIVQFDPTNSFDSFYPYFDPPIIGVADAADPLFKELKKKKVAGKKFMLPEEWLPGAQSVISYFLPFSTRVRTSNHEPGTASPEWMHGRFAGEEFNVILRYFLTEEMKFAKGKAVSPGLDKRMKVDYSNFTSTWSERHVAYVAGLGTFGLNAGLITKRGMAGRFGSVITDIKIEPTVRPYENHYQYCPHLTDGSCGECIERCPVGAITENGKDHAKCHHYLYKQNPLKDLADRYGYPYSACGKCQTNVPCEEQIP